VFAAEGVALGGGGDVAAGAGADDASVWAGEIFVGDDGALLVAEAAAGVGGTALGTGGVGGVFAWADGTSPCVPRPSVPACR